MVYLDLGTLQVAALVMCSVLGPISLAFAPAQPYMRPSRFWGAGLVALSGGLALVSLRDNAPYLVSQVLGLGLIGLALTFAYSSARAALNKVGRDTVGLTLLVLFFLVLISLDWLRASAWLRELFQMGMLGIMAGRVAYGFDRGRRLPESGALRAIGIIFGLFGVSLLLQAALAPVVSVSSAASATGSTDALLLVGLIAGLLLGTIVLLWVMTERIHASMRRLVSVDALTGALNRQAFVEQFEREAARVQRRTYAQFTVLLIDIDHFRRVNDAYGHEAGDRLLRATVEILHGMIRDYDLVGRLEGDVFMLLSPGTRSDAAPGQAERARREFEQQASARAGLKNRVSISVGIAVFDEHGDNWDAILRAADTATKIAKTLGGNRVEIATLAPPPSAATATATGANGTAGNVD